MQKRLMAILFFSACAFGLILLSVSALQGNPDKHEEAAPQPALPAVELNVAAAEAIYAKSCLVCHGEQLEGKMGPNLQKVGAKMTQEQIFKLVTNGKGAMPGFKSSLKEEEIANLSIWLSQHK